MNMVSINLKNYKTVSYTLRIKRYSTYILHFVHLFNFCNDLLCTQIIIYKKKQQEKANFNLWEERKANNNNSIPNLYFELV